MMSATYEQHSLPASFTFRIVEMVKRIRIHAMPRATALSWGLSLAAGVAIVVMTLGSQIAIRQLSEPLVFLGEITPRIREMSVDILAAPGTSLMAGKQGDIDGVGIDPRNPQDTSLLAPAKGGGEWTQKDDMPTARSGAGSAVVDGKIYVIGGAPVRCGITAVVEEYDPAADTWTTRAHMPTARQGLCAAAVDGIVYAIGGWAGNIATCWGKLFSTVEAYDPATDTWITKADMPTRRHHAAIAVVDGIIYVIGGKGQGDRILSTVEAYNPARDRWTRKASMPTARYQLAACAIDGRIYVSGGSTKRGAIAADFDPVRTVEVYDPAIDTWNQASDMPRTRMMHSASAVDGRMYIIGGVDFVGGVMPFTIDVYNPARDAWTGARDRLPTTRVRLTADVVDGKIYTIGGHTGPGTPILSIVEEYDLDLGLSDNIGITSPAGRLQTTWGKVRADQ